MDIILYLLSALGWTLPFFLYKNLTDYLTNIDIIIVSHLTWHIFILSFISYILLFKNKNTGKFINKIKNLPAKYVFRIFLIVIVGIVSQLSYIHLLKTRDVSVVIPNIRALSTILIAVLGYFLFKDNITFLKIIGLTLIIVGVYLVN